VRKLLALLPLVLAPLALAQVSQKPPDAVVVVVGSTAGQSGANFKTELQLTNATCSPMEGWLVLQPAVIARRYELAPRATLSFADLVADLGTTGLASLDILSDRGAVPTIVARAYDDQPTGTTGATIRALRAAEIMGRNDVSALIVPRDLSRYRFNIGVRTLELGATIELTVRDPAGNERHYRDLALPANHFSQQPADLFVGTALRGDESIEVRITSGRAIVYATTVDNRTNDSSLQVLGR
jgi:hypothetical protein